MNNTDWDAWMKEHHVKIYTEEELKRKQRKETFKKVKRFVERHVDDFINGQNAIFQIKEHMSDLIVDAATRQKHDSK